MKLVQAILVGLLQGYRWVLSPAKSLLFGPLGRCRFTPSCSAYALEAIRTHGALEGTWLAVRRVCRCHPWGGCGVDAVPGPSSCGHESPRLWSGRQANHSVNSPAGALAQENS